MTIEGEICVINRKYNKYEITKHSKCAYKSFNQFDKFTIKHLKHNVNKI